MPTTGPSRASRIRTWLVRTAGFLAFPVAGRVDDLVAALLGGADPGVTPFP